MGAGATDFRLFLNNGVFRRHPFRVCDIGAQAYENTDTKLEAEILKAFKRQSLPERPKYCRDFWRALGAEYASIDVDPEATLLLDMNFDKVPRKFRGKFSLVINCGTTEHVVNQMNAFTVIHDLTEVGGFMYHALPSTGYTNHGLFNYNMKFFFHLCRENHYKPVDCMFSFDEKGGSLNKDVIGFLRSFEHDIEILERSLVTMTGAIHILLMKTRTRDFVPPIDVPTEIVGDLPRDKRGRLRI